MNYTININNKECSAEQGETILDVLKRNGIKVPTLCHLKESMPTGACRMCIVEDMKSGKLITSCSFPAAPGMEIKTHSQRVVEARKTIIELLLSNHPDDCLYCVRDKNCELQNLSEEHHVRERRIRGKKNKEKLDLSSASIVRDPEKCILCGRCVTICEEVMGVSCIDFINRGNKAFIGTSFNQGLNTSSCINCGQCIMVCPTGALTEKNHFAEIQSAINDQNKTVVVQYAPSISVSMSEEIGLEPGMDNNGILNAALRKVGFDFIFDSSFAADLTIMEESAELIRRITNEETLPMITSCCPGWVKYAEEFYSDLIPNLSTCKSPQQMMGAVVKTYFAEKQGINPEDIYMVAIMPCTAKKFEAQREEMVHKGISDVDAVLTTRELTKFLKLYGVDMFNIDPEVTDSPLGFRSSAGKMFGASGGVMEAAIRTAHFKLTGKELVNFTIPQVRGFEKRKETQIKISDLELGVAVVNGMANAKVLLDEIRAGRKDIQFIEIMACPGGCIGGGGQHIGTDDKQLAQRMKTLYDIDKKETLKVSHKNPEIIELYQNFLGEPLGHKSHELLHTHYQKRDVMI
ncbi:MAG: iron hydrogenase small subunit [Bacteroidales bacterium]|nr:iron hydrogenase small subunit [Bacteroidales bacterium]